MKHRFSILLFVCLALSAHSFAQYTTKPKTASEDKQEKIDARDARIAKKDDYAIFRKQMLALKEYASEKKKIPALQKANKGMAVKVTVFVDSNDNDDDAKTLIGYIKQDVGDNTTNMYEITYDKSVKKITTVKRTPEAEDADKDAADEKEEMKSEKSSGTKKASTKKSKDDDDDPDDEKPAKNHKEKDDD